MAGGSWGRRAGAVAALVAGLVGCVAPTEMVSVNAAGTDSANGEVWDRPAVSPDGTKIAFTTLASDLGPVDGNGEADVYVRDLASGRVTLVSVNAAGTDSGNGESTRHVFSPDGTKVAFISEATDLGPRDPGPDLDVYVRDLIAGTTEVVSVDASTGGASDVFADFPVFSPDGTKIAFISSGANLGFADPDRPRVGWVEDEDVFVRDLVADTTTLVTANAAGTATANGGSYQPEFSPDGTRVLFVSVATDLGPTDYPHGFGEQDDVYVRDLGTRRTTLVSVNAWGTSSGNGPSDHASFAGDGAVVFQSNATDLGPPGSYCVSRYVVWPCDNIYRRDLRTGATSLVSVNTSGFWASSSVSQNPVVSPDGTRVAFESAATDLEPPGMNGSGLHLRDLTAARTSLVNVRPDGTPVDAVPYDASFDPSGRRILFAAYTGDFGFTDTNGQADIYVHDVATRQTSLVSINAAGTATGNQGSYHPAFVPGGPRVAFLSDATDLVATDTNGARDLFVAEPHAPPAPPAPPAP